jgi:hypothetical protein
LASAQAFDTIGAGSFGWLTQNGSGSVIAYSVGANVPIVSKTSSGFTLKNETTYLYSDGFSNIEVQALRTYLVAEKDVLSGSHRVPDPKVVGATVDQLDWRLFFGAGSGTWDFIKTGTSSASDQVYGAVTFRLGGEYKGFILQAAVDLVQIEGPDIIAPQIAFAFDF